MDPQEQLFGLIEAAEIQQKLATAAIATMAKECRELSVTISTLKHAAQTIQSGLEDAAGRAVRDSLNRSLKDAEEVTHQAKTMLRESTDQVREAGTWVSYKTAAAVGLVGALILGTVYGLGRYMLASTLTDLQDLQMKKAELQANVENLEQRGGRAKMTLCGGRLCIEANSNQGDGFARWESPWKSKSGANLVILRGY